MNITMETTPELPRKPLSLDDLMIYYKLPKLVKRRCQKLKNLSIEQEAIDIKYRLERLAICRKYSEQATQHLEETRNRKSDGGKGRRAAGLAGAEPAGGSGPGAADDEDSNDDCHFTAPNNPYKSPNSTTFPLTPFEQNPLKRIADKADDIKTIAESHPEYWLEESMSLTPMDLKQSETIREILSDCESKCNELLTQIANVDWELHEYEESLIGYHHEIEQAMVRFNTELSLLYNKRKCIISEETFDEDAENINLEALRNLLDCEDQLGEAELRSMSENLLPAYLKESSGSEWRNKQLHRILFRTENELSLINSIKGIPCFWHNSLMIALGPLGIIEPADQGPLRYLTDVRYFYDTERWTSSSAPPPVDIEQNCHRARYTKTNSDHRAQLLLFYFDQNPFFTNRVLMKSYHIDKSRQSGTEMFDGFWVTKMEGCTIEWIVNKLDCVNSFFDFFEQPQGLDSRGRSDQLLSKGRLREVGLDYGVFCRFRDFIAPHAIVAYSRGNLLGFKLDSSRKSLSKRIHYWQTLFER